MGDGTGSPNFRPLENGLSAGQVVYIVSGPSRNDLVSQLLREADNRPGRDSFFVEILQGSPNALHPKVRLDLHIRSVARHDGSGYYFRINGDYLTGDKDVPLRGFAGIYDAQHRIGSLELY